MELYREMYVYTSPRMENQMDRKMENDMETGGK